MANVKFLPCGMTPQYALYALTYFFQQGHSYFNGAKLIVPALMNLWVPFLFKPPELAHDFGGNLMGHFSKDIIDITALCWVVTIRNLATLSRKRIEYNLQKLACSDPVFQLGSTFGSFLNIPK